MKKSNLYKGKTPFAGSERLYPYVVRIHEYWICFWHRWYFLKSEHTGDHAFIFAGLCRSRSIYFLCFIGFEQSCVSYHPDNVYRKLAPLVIVPDFSSAFHEILVNEKYRNWITCHRRVIWRGHKQTCNTRKAQRQVDEWVKYYSVYMLDYFMYSRRFFGSMDI